MRPLILGGTRFLRRHGVTLLHRGRSGPELFLQGEHRIGIHSAFDTPGPDAVREASLLAAWRGRAGADGGRAAAVHPRLRRFVPAP